ncbi:hypothetical protein [Arthrobacter sp. Leaf137]|uniref:hypothetical protein n=1 Tax=Arthrobacter sp. Leaf137 TaxID=1736271 RepID=UPI0006F69A04|nr:hypothetical protein [Arthrobacter sp. Leaf137]KQQ80962.1 hypothetical protein ASF64_13070 [Arthrobacter sp. Leaf137]
MPRKIIKRLGYAAATLSAAMVASVGLVAASPAPAQAAGSCYYSSCYNVDPQTSGCSADAYTIGWPSGQTEIRYSPSCAASWLRSAQYGFSAWSQGGQDTYSRNFDGSVGGRLYTVNIPWAGYNGTWTKMVPMSSLHYTRVRINGWTSGYFNTNPGA